MKIHSLKETVIVSEDNHVITLEYGLTKISIPVSDDYINLIEFIRSRNFGEDVPEYNSNELKVVDFFINQGYLSYRLEDKMTLKDAKEIFDSIRVKWYKEYYDHPIWQLLKKGELNRNGLVAWLIHNYHVSRSAGMTDARFYSLTNDIKLKSAYKESCLEEYSHCDEFYFVQHPNLTISDQDVKNYIHLPASLAFDQQMLRMSESCWLGHVFISYFQEATVNYYDDCVPFYSEVEKVYNINGFFGNWKQHIELDLKYGHFGHFESIFSENEHIQKDYFEFALNHAWITYRHLYDALDEIIKESEISSEILLRNPIKDCVLDKSQTSLLWLGAFDEKVSLKNSKTLLELFENMKNKGLFEESQKLSLNPTNKFFIFYDIRELVLKALGFSKNHNTTITLGGIIKTNDFEINSVPQICISHTLMGVSNFLNELTYKPNLFIFAVRYLQDTSLCSYINFNSLTVSLLNNFLHEYQIDHPFLIDEYINTIMQLKELVSKVLNADKQFDFETEVN